MARIDSYSTGTLKLSDYLIGTDVSTENVTRSMPVSDIVSTILAAKSIGTVTSIATSDSTFINLAGGPITTTGSLTASLSASGVASSATFLRGDGTWSEPGPTPTDIDSAYNGLVLTTDTSSWDFTGTGVTASSINDNINVEIPGLLSSVEAILSAVGIDATGTVTSNPSTGDVTITNIGVYQARAGGHVTLTGSVTPLEFSSDVTVNTTANAGTVFSVNPGVGIDIVDNTTTPEADINYAGGNNYITSNIDIVSSDDIIAFQDLAVSEVKTAKLNTIPTSALTSLITTVDSGDSGKISNLESPAYPAVWKAKEIVTLDISQYNNICPGTDCDKNTLYVIVGPGTSYTATLSATYNVTGGAINVGYTALEEVNDGTGWVAASYLTAVAGTTYTFRITLTLLPGYTLSSGSLTASTSLLTMPANNTVDTLTITAVLTPPPSNNCVVTLNLIDQTTGVGAGNWGVSSGDANGATFTTTPKTGQFNFTTQVSGSGGYVFNTGPYYNGSITSGFSGNGNGTSFFTFDGIITGSLGPATYTATLNHPIQSVLNSDITVIGSSDTAYQLVGFTAWQSYSPSGFGQVIGGLNPSDPFTWGKGSGGSGSGLDFTIANFDSAGNVYDPTASTLAWKTAAGGGGSTISWPYGGSIPGGGGSQSITAYLFGTITYAPPASNYSVTTNYTDNITYTSGSDANITFAPLDGASSGIVASGQTYTIAGTSGSVPTATPDAGYYFSSSFSAANWNDPASSTGINPLTASLSSPPTQFYSDWKLTGTLDASSITVELQFQLANTYPTTPATYQVAVTSSADSWSYIYTSSGGALVNQTFWYNGSGGGSTSPLYNNFNIGTGVITVTIARIGSQWCNNISTSYCNQYAFGCSGATQYGCAVTVPRLPGELTMTYAGSTVPSNSVSWSTGGYYNVNYGSKTQSVVHGQTLKMLIREN